MATRPTLQFSIPVAGIGTDAAAIKGAMWPITKWFPPQLPSALALTVVNGWRDGDGEHEISTHVITLNGRRVELASRVLRFPAGDGLLQDYVQVALDVSRTGQFHFEVSCDGILQVAYPLEIPAPLRS